MTRVLKLFEEVKIMFRELPDVIARRTPVEESRVRSDAMPRHRASFMESFAIVEDELRRLATAFLRQRYPDLATAAAEGAIPKRVEQKGLERMTFGEMLALVKSFASTAETLPPELPTVLDDLQQVVSVRNQLAHGRAIEPEDAVRAMETIRRFMNLRGL
jgi:hypothetical protein